MLTVLSKPNSNAPSIAETTGFVDKLFDCLTTKNYLVNNPAKETPKEEVKPLAVKSDLVEVNERNKKPLFDLVCLLF